MQNITKAETTVTRRRFVVVSAAASVIAGSPTLLFAQKAKGEVPRRTLGRTGEKVSVIGPGGFHIGIPAMTDAEWLG